MTNRLHPGAIREDELTREDDEYQSYLALEEFPEREFDSPEYRFVIMGDLRPIFDVEDDFEPDDEGLFGHYIVEAEIKQAIEVPEGIILDSEGGTFFAYSAEEHVAHEFMDRIKKLALERATA